MICAMCFKDKPLTDFSTLPRFQSFELTGSTCTDCYWRQMVLEYPEYQEDGLVIYRPYDQPLTAGMNLMKRWLPGWVVDEKVIRKYQQVGDIGEQVRPFWEFVESVS